LVDEYALESNRLGAMVLILATFLSIFQNQDHDRRISTIQPYNAKLERIAQCESSGRWFINTGNGYYGGLQFTLSTWRSVGGRGYPHQNSKLEQKFRAVLLIKQRGYSPWPVCGYV
jgi:hypothetical protein